MSKQDIKADYAPGDIIRVIDPNSTFINKTGSIDRLGSAGDVIYLHVQLFNVSTIIAFIPRQVERIVKDVSDNTQG